MQGRTLRYLLPIMVTLVVGASTSNAQASSTNVVQVIKSQDKIVRRMPAFAYLNAHLNTSSKAVAKKLVPELGPLVRASTRAIAVVARSSTSSARQQRGKAHWVKGSQEDNTALLQYRSALEDLIASKQAAFKATDARAQKLLAKGVTLSSKGDQLLGLSAND